MTHSDRRVSGEEHRASAHSRRASEQRASARVLVVDDNPFVRNALVRVLQEAGFKLPVMQAPDYQTAWIVIAGKSPGTGGPAVDVVITDYDLRGWNTGLSVVEACRDRDIPVVMISGFGMREKLDELSFEDVPALGKAEDYDTLLQTVDGLLGVTS